MSSTLGDPTTLGAILVTMGVLSPEQLDEAVEAQENSSIDRQLGNQLVVMRFCDLGQVEEALQTQERMRKNGHSKALAVADIALARQKKLDAMTEEVLERSARVVRSATGQDHPAITPAVLAAEKV